MACYPKRSALAAHPATSVAAAGLEIGILRWRGQARIVVEVEARACPLRQLQKTHGGVGVLPYLPPEQRATLPASGAVTAVTDLHYGYPIIFWTPCGAVRDLAGRKSRPWASLVQDMSLLLGRACPKNSN